MSLPTVNSVNPNSGVEAGGGTVTILGTGFTGATAVYFGYSSNTFNALVSATYTVVSDTEITATVPASNLSSGIGMVNVIVMDVNSVPSLPNESCIYTYIYANSTSFSLTTLTHTFVNADGSTATGYVTFTLGDMMTNGDETYMPTRFESALVAGALSQELPSNIDTGTVPSEPWNTRWRVDFHITGAIQRTFWIVVPAGGETIDLFDLIPWRQQL